MHETDFNDYKTMTLFNFFPKNKRLKYGINSIQKEEQLNIKNLDNKNIIHRNIQKNEKAKLTKTIFFSKEKNKLVPSSSKLKFSQSKKSYMSIQSRIKLYKTTTNFFKEQKIKINKNETKTVNNNIQKKEHEPNYKILSDKNIIKKREYSIENQVINQNGLLYDKIFYQNKKKNKDKSKNSMNMININLLNQENATKKNNYISDDNSTHMYKIYQIQNLKNTQKSTFKFKTKDNFHKKYYNNQLPLLKKNNSKKHISLRGISITELNTEKNTKKRLTYKNNNHNYLKNNSNKENNVLNDNIVINKNKNMNIISYDYKDKIKDFFSPFNSNNDKNEFKNEYNFSNNDKTKQMNSTNSDFNKNIIFNKTNTNSFYNSNQNNKLNTISSTNSIIGAKIKNNNELIFSNIKINLIDRKENNKNEEKKINKDINLFANFTGNNFFMDNNRKKSSINNFHEVKYSLNAKKGFQRLENNFNTIDSYYYINSNKYNSNINSPYKKNKLEKYKIGAILGKGAYATVKLVEDRMTNEKYAMKIYDKIKLNDSLKKKCVCKEIEILKKINHKNIAKLIEIIHTENSILIIQEYVKGISLRDYYNSEIRNQKGISEHKEKIFKKIFKQIFEAMNYLHINFIAHRDIKLENILMTKQYEIKIIDFGFGMLNPENKLQYFFCGTPNYMPPEIVEKKGYIGQRADLWSLGILIYKIYCADFPFKGRNEKELYKAIKRCEYYIIKYVPNNVKRVIRSLIEYEPSKRPTCKDILRSEWLKN